MSYVEKAFYKYIKSIFTTGIKVLFSRKYIFYTVAFILITITSTVFYLIERQLQNVSGEILGIVGDILVAIELSAAVTYVFFGICFARYPFKFWVGPAFLTTAGGAVLLYFVDVISPYIATIGYLSWILVSVFITFSLSRNFWGNKVLGSIMFLGKQDGEGTIIFGWFVFVLTLTNAGMGGFLIYKAINPLQITLIITAGFAVLAVVLVNLMIFRFGKSDDVFYTILAFFYVFASFTLWKLTFYTAQGNDARDNVGSVLIALFLIFYTVSTYGRRVKRIEKGISEELVLEEVEETKKKKDKEITELEEVSKWFLLRIPRFLSPLGVLMTVMGLILSYHVTYLQFLTEDDLFSVFYLSKTELAGLRDKFAIILLACIIIFLLLNYRMSENFRRYASPELYRFEFLPPFDELVERLDRIRRGEDSWKQYANMVIKEGIKVGAKSAARKVIVSPTKKVAGAIGGAYSKTKGGVKKVFRRKKK
ncbi:MAG: hypothetical protein HGN29_12255 [Asgard group archaeon]|nr:hypothetical protein [Asgard group archaeon]